MMLEACRRAREGRLLLFANREIVRDGDGSDGKLLVEKGGEEGVACWIGL